MAKFATRFSDRKIVQEVLAQITWYHNIVLLDKVADMDERKWYIQKSAENGWSRNVLENLERICNVLKCGIDDIVELSSCIEFPSY